MAANALPDMNAMLANLQKLQEENRAMASKLETVTTAAQQKDQAIAQLEQQNNGLKQSNQAIKASRSKEMQSMMTGFGSWVDELPVDAETKRLIKAGMNAIVEAGDADSCVFKTFITASQESVTRASQMEALRIENEELKKRANGGVFGAEDARLTGQKRPAEDMSANSGTNSNTNTEHPANVWDEALEYFKQNNGVIS